MPSRRKGRVKLVGGKTGGFTELLGVPDMVLEVVSKRFHLQRHRTVFSSFSSGQAFPNTGLPSTRGNEYSIRPFSGPAGKGYSAGPGKTRRLCEVAGVWEIIPIHQSPR